MADIQGLQNEVMKRLMNGEPMPDIIKDLQGRGNTTSQKKKVKITKEQREAGLATLNNVLDSITELMLIFGYKLEAAKMQSLDQEKKIKILENMDTIVQAVSASANNMINK